MTSEFGKPLQAFSPTIPRLLVCNESVVQTAVSSHAMEAAVDNYLDVSLNRQIVVQLVWPGRPHNPLLIHILATLRLRGTARNTGLRGLFYPSKASSCHSLMRYYVEVHSLLKCVREAAQAGDLSAATIVLMRLQDFAGKTDQDKKTNLPVEPHVNDVVLHFRPIFKSIWPNIHDRLFRGLRKDMRLRYCPSLPEMGEPALARDAVFHLPHMTNIGEIKELLMSPALKANPPLVLFVDATRQTLASCAFNLRSSLRKVIRAAYDTFKDNSPGVYVLTDDPIMGRHLVRDLLKNGQKWKGAAGGKRHLEVRGTTIDWWYGDKGFDQTSSPALATVSQPIRVRVEGLIVGPVHQKIYNLCKALREASLEEALRQLQTTNRFLRRIVTLPCSIVELKKWLNEAGLSDEELASYGRNLIWKAHAPSLNRIFSETAAAAVVPDIRPLIEEITRLHDGFENGTPMANALCDGVRWALANTLSRIVIILPKRFHAMLARRFLQSQCIGASEDAERITCHDGAIPEALFGDDSIGALIVACNPEDHLEILLSRDFRGDAGTILIFDVEGAKKASKILDTILQDPQLRSYHSRAQAIKRELDKVPHQLLKFPLIQDIGNAFKLSDGHWREGGGDSGLRAADQGTIYFTDRLPMICGRDSQFCVYDTESWSAPKFIIKSAKDLSEGDIVFLMPGDLRSEIESLLRTGGAHSLQHELLENYHKDIIDLATRIAGNKAAVAREIFKRMCTIDSAMSEVENINNVSRWINVGPLKDIPIEKRRPQAPRRYRHFRAFAKAIGLEEVRAETYWRISICQIRSDRITEGREASEFFTRLLFDETFAKIRAKITTTQVDNLRSMALDNLHEIQRVQF